MGYKTVALVVKYHQDEAARMAVEIGKYLLLRNYKVVIPRESQSVAKNLTQEMRVAYKDKVSQISCVPKPKVPEQADIVIVLGGDGTFLSIARLMKTRSVPIMGINMGQLGFLTEIKKAEAFDVLSRIFDRGEIKTSSRKMMQVTMKRGNKVLWDGPVVNDAVISKGAIARIVGMELTIDGQYAHTMRADGLILSTPTGSTAYSLAAGGPILEPTLGAFVITPICPHGLTLRPLVVPDSMEFQIRLNYASDTVHLTLDGQDSVDLKENDIVVVRQFSAHDLQIVRSPFRDYFALLREKFKFGERA